jgi:signal transduction histidine kinase
MTSSEDILIVAPTGADARNIRSALLRAELHPRVCRSTAEAAEHIATEPGALLLTEEALARGRNVALSAALDRQPAWSDLPIVIVTSDGSMHRWAADSAVLLGARSNVTLVARPLQTVTLVAAVTAVLRARRRQYQIRDLLRERETLLGSLEQRVQERTAKLQEVVAELESFSYSVSHDLRAPLRVMAGYAQVVLEDHGSTLAPEVRDYIERIARSADRMDRLTQDVLAYTRLTRGEIALERVDLECTLRELIEQYPELGSAREGIVLRSPLLPVIGHAPVLAQALANLLGNALKFTRPQVPPRIEVFTRRLRGDRVRIVVKDNGVGIDPAHHEKIFRIFERVAGRDVPGTGIGLAIVKKAAERMSGSVGVKSQFGRGSEFWIELPRALTPKPARSRAHRGR